MRRSHGFTLIELLVVLAIILLLVGILAPSLTPVMELARRQKCAANLNKLVKDCRTYASQNEQFFPSTYNDTGVLADGTSTAIIYGSNFIDGVTAGVADRLVDQTLPSGNANRKAPGHAGPSRSLYLLPRLKFTALDAFICPSTEHTATALDATGKSAADPNTDFDFYSAQQLSYSYQAHKNGGDGKYWPMSMTSDAALIVLADRNPIIGEDCWDSAYTNWSVVASGGTARRCGMDKVNKNSFNHTNQEGQNVVDSSSTVRWTTTPNCGSRLWNDAGTPTGDNIWTWGDAGTGVAQTVTAANAGHYADSWPTNAGDSFLH